jgi:hypothetical protein
MSLTVMYLFYMFDVQFKLPRKRFIGKMTCFVSTYMVEVNIDNISGQYSIMNLFLIV